MSFDLTRVLDGPQPVAQILRQIEDLGDFEAYVVGGYVRDTLLGYNVDDADVDILVHAVNAAADQIERLERLLYNWGLKKVKQATGDIVYTGGSAQQLEVTLTHDLDSNLADRDLTINAIAVNRRGRVKFTGLGLEDLEDRVFRLPRDEETLRMDPRRFVRYARFASEMPEFAFDPGLLRVIKSKQWLGPLRLPFDRDDRMGQEIMKLLRSRNPARGVRLIAEWDLLPIPFPALEHINYPQDPQHHDFDVKEHTLRVVEHLRGQPPHVLLAGLYHDAGKPHTATRDGSRIHFYGHEEASARLATRDLARLGLPNELIEKVRGLILEHMNMTSASPRAVRRLMARLKTFGVDIRELLALRLADRKAQKIDWVHHVDFNFHDNIAIAAAVIESEEQALTVNDLKINGDDIMEFLGAGPGPEIGRIKQELLEAVLDDPTLNTRESLLALLKEKGLRKQWSSAGEAGDAR